MSHPTAIFPALRSRLADRNLRGVLSVDLTHSPGTLNAAPFDHDPDDTSLRIVLLPGHPEVAAWIGRLPAGFTAAETALVLAARSYAATGPSADALGIGAVLTPDDRLIAALQSERATRCETMNLTPTHTTGRPLRENTDAALCELLDRFLNANDSTATESALTPTGSAHHITSPPLLSELWHRERDLLWSLPDGSISDELPQPPAGLLCGSFHPLHIGHEQLRDAAEQFLGEPVAFELAITNPEKPTLDYLTIEHRRRQFTAHPLALTTAPTFAEKARVLPGICWIVGWDTAERILAPRFYDDDRSRMITVLAELGETGGRFLVAGRQVADHYRSLADLTIPSVLDGLFHELPETRFRHDISSTQHRLNRPDKSE